MKTEYFIPKNRVLPYAQDSERLRQAGMKYIEKLGSKFWTDYNPHDPGITIMEVLAYAITELGYRTDFDIKDIVSNKEGIISNQSFFPANDILINAPLTELDYRKLLIDIDNVSNAWFLATKKTKDTFGFFQPNDNEKPVYINVLEDKLSFVNTDYKNQILQPLSIRGLNKVTVELDEDPKLGDLNSTYMDFEFLEQERWIQVSILPSFSSWNSTDTLLIAELAKSTSIVPDVSNGTTANKIVLLLTDTKTGRSLKFIIEATDKSEIGYASIYFMEETGYKVLLNLFNNKKITVDKVFLDIRNKLQENRNFSEDYIEIDTINAVRIGVCAKIEIMPQTNIADVMAQIQIAIYDIISPSVKFYTLTQLTEQGYHSEDVFIGPKLSHGFLKDDELINSQLPTSIHSSDIIAALMKLEGVAAVNDVLLTLYNEKGEPDSANSNKAWSISLPGNVRPVFSSKKSRLQLYQKNIPFLLSEANQMIVDQKVQIYKSLQKNHKLEKPDASFPFPSGTFYQLDEYYSIQDEFPATYGIGKNKLSETVSDKRKSQAKQLQGYLYFYEQILADFFSQLYNAKELLDTTTLKASYFPKFIEKDDLTGNTFYSTEILSDVLKEKLSVSDNDDISLYETQTVFYDRRNRALDHLIARFGESFNDYVFMMYQVQQNINGLGSLGKENVELIQDKQNFIESYPEISSNRALGMNYTVLPKAPASNVFSNYWDTSNIGGYAKRAAKLLGVNEWPLQPSSYQNAKDFWVLNIENEPIFFRIQSPEDKLSKKKQWANENMANLPVYMVFPTVDEIPPGVPNPEGYYIYMVEKDIPTNTQKKIVKIDKKFTNPVEANSYINTTIKDFVKVPYEFFYCMEHILLRPFQTMKEEEKTDDPEKVTDLFSVCLKDDCDDIANNDPYSFKASIILPGKTGRFGNITFREYAEKVFRQEAPAHVLLKICWVSPDDMKAFEEEYEKWRQSYPAFRIYSEKGMDNAAVKKHVKNHESLLRAIKNLNTIYPEGNLYDCHLSETSNPIILGNTALGNL